jgi:hypothetical protein
MNLSLDESLEASERPLKILIGEYLNYLASQGCAEAIAYNKKALILQKFAQKIQPQSLHYLPPITAKAFIEDWTFEIVAGTGDDATDLTAHYKFGLDFEDPADREKATLEFQKIMNNIFTSIYFTFNYLKQHNPILEHITLLSDPKNGRMTLSHVDYPDPFTGFLYCLVSNHGT